MEDLEQELKPCPFCGDITPNLLLERIEVVGSRVLFSEAFFVKCIVCKTTTPKYHFAEEAIEFWNQRSCQCQKS